MLLYGTVHGTLSRFPASVCGIRVHGAGESVGMAQEGAIRYKFRSSTEQYSVRFDGPHIPLTELRAKVVEEHQIVSKGREAFVLEFLNAQACISLRTSPRVPASHHVGIICWCP